MDQVTNPRPITENDIAAIREATRAAHEAIKDLKALVREAKQVTEEMQAAAGHVVAHGIDDAVRIGLDSYTDEISKAICEAKRDVYARFDRLANTLLGETKRRQGDGVLSEYAQMMAAQEAAAVAVQDLPWEPRRERKEGT